MQASLICGLYVYLDSDELKFSAIYMCRVLPEKHQEVPLDDEITSLNGWMIGLKRQP